MVFNGYMRGRRLQLLIKQARDLYTYKDLLMNLTFNELKLKYKNSIMGFLWSLLNPLMMLIIYSIAFKIILRIPVENFALFVFIGLLPWMFVQGSISQSTNSIINNQNLLKKVYFPRIIIPMSVIMSNLINFLINLIVLLAALFIYNIEITIAITLFPLITFVNWLIVAGLSILLSSITVKYRDISHLVDVIFMAWFYLTPIIYPLSMVPEPYKSIIQLNPFTGVVEMYREILLDGKIPDQASILTAFLYGIMIFILGVYVFYKREKDFVEEL
ncbi:MAG: ABC transporter permease [Firmicutes bacterium]|nr:ABC transporter permease [Bacillota bacterium]